MAKIMLVEDDRNLSAIYRDRLLAEGHEIVSASDGEEALAMAVKEKPDLIISDVMMPKISGFDMLDILRSTPETKDTKVVMMTALSQTEDKDRASKLGADKYLVKSQVTLDDVARVVNEVLTGQSSTPQVTATPVSQTPPAMMTTEVPIAAPTPVTTPSPVVDTVPPDLPAPEPPAAPVAPVTPNPTTGAPAPDPGATAAPTAQDTASEQAEVAAQIDKFLSTNIPDTPVHEGTTPTTDGVPSVMPAMNPATPVEPPVQPTPPTQPDPAAAPQHTFIQQPATPQPAEDSYTPDEPPKVAAPTNDISVEPISSKSLSHERVIEPINDPNTHPDIHSLYEKEMAKEAANTPVPTPPVGTVIQSPPAPDEQTAAPQDQQGPHNDVPNPNDPAAFAL